VFSVAQEQLGEMVIEKQMMVFTILHGLTIGTLVEKDSCYCWFSDIGLLGVYDGFYFLVGVFSISNGCSELLRGLS
jgi:hypothetical protein